MPDAGTGTVAPQPDPLPNFLSRDDRWDDLTASGSTSSPDPRHSHNSDQGGEGGRAESLAGDAAPVEPPRETPASTGGTGSGCGGGETSWLDEIPGRGSPMFEFNDLP